MVNVRAVIYVLAIANREHIHSLARHCDIKDSIVNRRGYNKQGICNSYN